MSQVYQKPVTGVIVIGNNTQYKHTATMFYRKELIMSKMSLDELIENVEKLNAKAQTINQQNAEKRARKQFAKEQATEELEKLNQLLDGKHEPFNIDADDLNDQLDAFEHEVASELEQTSRREQTIIEAAEEQDIDRLESLLGGKKVKADTSHAELEETTAKGDEKQPLDIDLDGLDEEEEKEAKPKAKAKAKSKAKSKPKAESSDTDETDDDSPFGKVAVPKKKAKETAKADKEDLPFGDPNVPLTDEDEEIDDDDETNTDSSESNGSDDDDNFNLDSDEFDFSAFI